MPSARVKRSRPFTIWTTSILYALAYSLSRHRRGSHVRSASQRSRRARVTLPSAACVEAAPWPARASPDRAWLPAPRSACAPCPPPATRAPTGDGRAAPVDPSLYASRCLYARAGSAPARHSRRNHLPAPVGLRNAAALAMSPLDNPGRDAGDLVALPQLRAGAGLHHVRDSAQLVRLPRELAMPTPRP